MPQLFSYLLPAVDRKCNLVVFCDRKFYYSIDLSTFSRRLYLLITSPKFSATPSSFLHLHLGATTSKNMPGRAIGSVRNGPIDDYNGFPGWNRRFLRFSRIANGRTDRRRDGRTDPHEYRDARTHLKTAVNTPTA